MSVMSTIGRMVRRIARQLGPALALVLIVPLAQADFADAKKALKKKDYAQAFAEFERLSALGYGPATFKLAEMIVDGHASQAMSDSEVQDSSALALAWYELADEQGDDDARLQAKKLKRKLSEEQQLVASEVFGRLQQERGREALDNFLLPASLDLESHLSGKAYRVARLEETPGLKWPAEYHFGMQAGSVFLEYDIDAYGIARDYRLQRETPAPFVRESIAHLKTVRFAKTPQYGQVSRYVFFISNRDEGTQNYGEAKLLRKLKKRAEHGSPYRKYFYGVALELHQAMHKSYDPASFNRWYIQAAQGGYAKAQYIVGNRLLRGESMAQSTAKALRWLESASTNGSAEGAYLLSRISEDQTHQARLLNMAAERGHTTAMLKHAMVLSQQNKDEEAQALVEAAKSHLDQLTWLEVAAQVYATTHQEKAREYRSQASVLAADLGYPLSRVAASQPKF